MTSSVPWPAASWCRAIPRSPVDDLIWDNTNKALAFREDVLNLHRLDDAELEALLERLEEGELDDYTDIVTLIGIEFDENTPWASSRCWN